jgi:hypothetical protein
MRWAVAAILCVLATASLAASNAPSKTAGNRGPLYNKPVYDPATKSYFELYYPDSGVSAEQARTYTWTDAAELAQMQVFKGVHGRLAVVKTRQIDEFLIETFRPASYEWIGLRYVCGMNVLQWVTGEIWPLTSYANWGPVWNVAGASPFGAQRAACGGGGGWLGIHYWPRSGSFRWNANTAQTKFAMMFVEFPTGKR